MPLPLIDPVALAKLRSLGGNDDGAFLREVITLFLEDTPLRIAQMKEHRQKGEREGYIRSVHTIKGSSSNLGALELKHRAEELENHVRQQGLTSHVGFLAQEVETGFHQTAEALRAYW